MRFLITFGPTYEPLDEVRRLTNFSTGRLGSQLVNRFAEAGHEVTALRGHYATCHAELKAAETQEFSTTDHLLERLRNCSARAYDAVFHAAAVSDFKFGRVGEKGPGGDLIPLRSGKFSTRSGVLLAELVPAVKIISQLRGLFGSARIFGWKYEVDGSQAGALAAGARQIRENQSDFCVVNGRAYGDGFGLLARDGSLRHAAGPDQLAAILLESASGAKEH